MTTWADLFDRADAVEGSVDSIREALASRRAQRANPDDQRDSPPLDDERSESTEPGHDDPPGRADPARLVADADVLAADLLAGGAAREALDPVRAHSWIDLVASDPLLEDAAAAIHSLAGDRDPDLAADWRDRIERDRVRVTHPAGDHPGLASAYRGGAAHLLTFEENLADARAGLGLQPHVDLSVRPPDAFGVVFDAAGLYGAVESGEYPGPDRDPRK